MELTKKMTVKIPLIATVPLNLEPQPEGGYVVTSPALPEMLTEGDTVEECLFNVSDCFAAVVEIYEYRDKALPEGMVVVDMDKPITPCRQRTQLNLK